MTAVGIGMVGIGKFGSICLEAFAALPDVSIAALTDADPTRAATAAAAYQTTAYSSLDDLLRDPTVEIVALATPPHLHADAVRAALRAGKHVFCEPPLALTRAEAEAIRVEAERANRFVVVDYVLRHNPFWEAAVRLRRDGILGDLLHIDITNHTAGLELPPTHWFWDTAQSGGIWIEHGIHFFDACAWIAGVPGSVAAAQSFARADAVIDGVEALAAFDTISAHFYHNFIHDNSTQQTTVYMTFERGYVALRDWMPTSIEIWASTTPAQTIPYLVGVTEAVDETSSGRLRHWISHAPEGSSILHRTAIQAGMRDLIGAVRAESGTVASTLRATTSEEIDSLRMALQAVERDVSIRA